MRNIITFILLMFLQNGFCRNITNEIVKNNDELVQKLSKDADFVKFYKLSLASSLTKYLASETIKNGKEVTIEEKLDFEDIVKKAVNSYEKVLVKFPELNNISFNEKKEVLEKSFTKVAALTQNELGVCFASAAAAVGACSPSGFTTIQKVTFFTCMAISAVEDINIMITSAGTATLAVANMVTPEVMFCARVSLGSATTVCLGGIITTIVECIQREAKD